MARQTGNTSKHMDENYRPKILFLIADTGAGHRASAKAVLNAIKIIASGKSSGYNESITEFTSNPVLSDLARRCEIQIVDPMKEYCRFPITKFDSFYGSLIRYNPRTYGFIFHVTNHRLSSSAAHVLFTPTFRRGMRKMVAELKPDVFVSLHPLLNDPVIKSIKATGHDIPFITVVLDLISVHADWFSKNVTTLIAPTVQGIKAAKKMKVPEEKIKLLGMPIDPKFNMLVDDKKSLRLKLGIDLNMPTVLLVGGGDGAGGLYRAARAISKAKLPVQLLIVTGRNERLLGRLQKIQERLQVKTYLYGFVQNMPEMMHAADVIITKAGPGTITEAMACNLPILLTAAVPGQEVGNIKYVVDNGLGYYTPTPDQLVYALQRLIDPSTKDLQQIHKNIARIFMPKASFDIARTILEQAQAMIERMQNGDTITLEKARRLSRIRRMRLKLRSPIHVRKQSGSTKKSKVMHRISRTRRLMRMRRLHRQHQKGA